MNIQPKKKLTARAGANINRALMVRKIKAVFWQYRKDSVVIGSTCSIYDVEQELLRYASKQAPRSKKRLGGL